MTQLRDLLIIIALTLFLAELFLKITGFMPYRYRSYSIKSEPAGALIGHPEMGFALHPGSFQVTINHFLKYNTTQLNDATRTTGKSGDGPKISIYGCSFTYGMGVHDSLTFPYLLQARLPEAKVKNFAVPGYGNLHALLGLQTAIKQSNKPDFVVVSYAFFHEERNILAANYRNHLKLGASKNIQKAIANYPFAKGDTTLEIHHFNIQGNNRIMQLRQQFSLVNLVAHAAEIIASKRQNPAATTLLIMKEIHSLCKENNIQMVVVGLQDDQQTIEGLARFEIAGIPTLNIGLPIATDTRYNNSPFDSHPNTLAHGIYAERLFGYLEGLR